MEPQPAASPATAYRDSAKARRETEASLQKHLDRIGWARVAVALFGVLQVIDFFTMHFLPPWLLAAPVIGLVALTSFYMRVKSRRDGSKRAAEFHEFGLARIEERWHGQGEQGSAYLNDEHLYAADLDLFGRGSLFERICEARTRIGQDTLADWLLAPAMPVGVVARQQAVADLRPRWPLRERLAVLGSRIPTGIDTGLVERWATAATVLPGWGRYAVHGWTVVLAVVLLLASFDLVSWWVFFAVLAGQGLFVVSLFARTSQVLRDIEPRSRDLFELTEIMAVLENEPFAAPLLVDLQRDLKADGVPPSKQLRRLVSLVDLLNARRNQLFFPIALILMWGTRMAYQLEAWRLQHGPVVGRWFRHLGEMEALLSLAGYAFENPHDPFPEIVSDRNVLEGTALGHPLVPHDRCVRNDIHLDEVHLLIVSGSNMSGKSTFLRTVGINTVLALAGATVRAKAMRLSPFAIGATLRIQDSLQAGKSRFFAEITRIQRIVSLASGPLPLLFLLDELLHGTNSHDRRVGAAAILRTLLDRGAFGMITTHDLALSELVQALGSRAANVHFADHLEKGEIVFDYRMRPGIVQHSNAVALMRAVGLPVD